MAGVAKAQTRIATSRILMKLFFIGVSFLFFTENYRSNGTAGFINTGMNGENQDQKWMLAVFP